MLILVIFAIHASNSIYSYDNFATMFKTDLKWFSYTFAVSLIIAFIFLHGATMGLPSCHACSTVSLASLENSSYTLAALDTKC